VGGRRRRDGGGVRLTSVGIATRGDQLALCRTRGATSGPEAFDTELLRIVEIDANDRVVARVVFDLDDVDAAFEELDARYLAGEAGAHAHTWAVIAQAFRTLNRHELPATTPELVNVDHRRVTKMAHGELIANILASWDVVPDLCSRVEAVHRLSNLGAVVTWVANGTSQEGFEAEWRSINVLTVHGELLSRVEVFDETDLDAALARFDELTRPAPRLKNAASRVGERYLARFVSRDWNAITDFLADDFVQDDRRRVVGAGVRHGLDAQVSDMRAFAELSITNVTPTVIATRGERLVLTRTGFSFRDQGSEAYVTEVIGVGEINSDEKITAAIAFDLDDIDAAFEELDTRFIAREAAAHAHTWSVIARSHAALNRRELPATTPDWVNVDRRRLATIETGQLAEFIRTAWDITPDRRIDIEAVHRLTNLEQSSLARHMGPPKKALTPSGVRSIS
jgi:hypothetical protein